MKIKRREFLHKSAIVVAGVSAAATGVTAAGLAAEWTARLKTLTAHEGETLLKMARQIFPHDRLDDSYYMKVVEDLDIEASRKPVTGRMLRAGVANLDLSAKGKFAARPAAEQVSALEKIQHTPFFEKVRSTEMVALYNNHGRLEGLRLPGRVVPFRRLPASWLQRSELAARSTRSGKP